MATVALVGGCAALLSIWKVAYVGDKVRSPALLGRHAGNNKCQHGAHVNGGRSHTATWAHTWTG